MWARLKSKLQGAAWYVAIAFAVVFGGALFIRERKKSRLVRDILADQKKADALRAKIQQNVDAAAHALPPKPIPAAQADVDAELRRRGLIE